MAHGNPTTPLPPPPHIPNLHALKPARRGGQGYIFEGMQGARPVAVKVLGPEAWSLGARERFVRETQTLLALEHRFVERCYGAGLVDDAGSVFDGQPYGVMEWLGDYSLEDRRKSGGPLRVGRVVSIARDLLEVLVYLHEPKRRARPVAIDGAALGVLVHRDIKPSNLMYTTKRVRAGYAFATRDHPQRHASP